MEIKDIGYAVRLFYEKIELNNDDIKNLFGVSSPSTVKKLKDRVLPVMAARGIPQYNPHGVNTDIAYEVWGLDISAMERKYKKLQRLGFSEVTT